MRLGDLVTGRMSWRRLKSLVDHLPPTSHVARSVHGDRWPLTDQLLAHVADLLAAGNWQRAGNKKAKRPKPIPRPGINAGKRFGNKSMTPDEWRRRYEARFEVSTHGD